MIITTLICDSCKKPIEAPANGEKDSYINVKIFPQGLNCVAYAVPGNEFLGEKDFHGISCFKEFYKIVKEFKTCP